MLEFANNSGMFSNTNYTVVKVGPSFSTFSNSAGGVDYAYAKLDSEKKELIECDQAIWASGDILTNTSLFPNGFFGRVYGLQGIEISKLSTALPADYYYYDLNYDPAVPASLGSVDKTLIGDVDVYRDPCRGSSCMPIKSIDIICLDAVKGTYQIIVTFVNNNPFSLTAENLGVVYPDGTPATVPIAPPVAPGQTGTVTFNLNYPGGTAGQAVTLDVQLGGKKFGDGLAYCCPPQEIRFILPPCRCFDLGSETRLLSNGQLIVMAKNNLVDPAATYAEIAVSAPNGLSDAAMNANINIPLNQTGPVGVFTITPAPAPGQHISVSITLFGKKKQLSLYENCCTETFTVYIPGGCGNACRMSSNWSGGVVYFDVNQNGRYDPGERPVTGQQVLLGDSAGRATSTDTNALGEYYFTDLTVGEPYFVTLGELSVPRARVTPAEGRRFRLTQGQPSPANDFGLIAAGTPSLQSISLTENPGGIPQGRSTRKDARRGEFVEGDTPAAPGATLEAGQYRIRTQDDRGQTVMRERSIQR